MGGRLQEIGVPKNIIKWYEFYFINRYVKVKIGTTERCRFLRRGMLQERILSPVVWNMVFDGLLRQLEKVPGIKQRGYVDDGVFLVAGCCPNTLVELAQPAINAAVAWGSNTGLKFSSKKTQMN